MALSVTISNLHRSFGHDLRWMVELAKIADLAGIDQIAVSDHVLMGERTDLYPFGKFPFRPDEPWMEPLTVLAAIASVTQRVRLATGILIAPLRSAPLLAKTVATLDVLSGGRVDLGVGIGWQREEYDAVGVPFEKRWDTLTDTLRACRALWRDVPASFGSPSVRFERVYSTPLPVQTPIPIWYGARMSPALARRIADLGEGWYPLASATAGEIHEGASLLREAFVAARRDPSTIRIRAGLPAQRGADAAAELRAAGATILAVPMAGIRSLDAAKAYFEAVVAELAA